MTGKRGCVGETADGVARLLFVSVVVVVVVVFKVWVRVVKGKEVVAACSPRRNKWVGVSYLNLNNRECTPKAIVATILSIEDLIAF